ncbi:MAG: CARDB domain-containing protein, partial [Candidatus Binatia bacterium]
VLFVQNMGTETAPPTLVSFFFSSDPFLDVGDTFFRQSTVKSIRPGERRKVKFRRQTPPASPTFIIAVVDADNRIVEPNELDNIIVVGPIPNR